MTETTKTVYLALSMPENSDEPIYAHRIGETIEAAKDAIEDATQGHAPGGTILNLEWEDCDSLSTVARGDVHGWLFRVKEYDLHSEE